MAKGWKYLPTHVGAFDRKGRFHAHRPVTSVKLHPPVTSATHPGTAIRGDWFLAEIFTEGGRPRHYGFVDGCIGARLKMAVKLGPGQERDEVIAKWKNAPADVCGRRPTKKRRRK